VYIILLGDWYALMSVTDLLFIVNDIDITSNERRTEIIGI
jgi:hypothetical protein